MGLEVGHAVGPPMSATLSCLTMLAALSGHEVGHAVGPPLSLATLLGLIAVGCLLDCSRLPPHMLPCALRCVSRRTVRHDAGCASAGWPASRDVRREHGLDRLGPVGSKLGRGVISTILSGELMDHKLMDKPGPQTEGRTETGN